MPLSKVRVVVVTRETDIYNAINYGLANSYDCEIVISVNSIISVETKLVKLKPNVLIVDLDSAVVSSLLLQRLTEKFKLLVILTGKDEKKALPLMLTNDEVKNFVNKSLTKLSINSYVADIIKLVRAFTISIQTLNYNDMKKTVDIDQKVIVIGASTGGTEVLESVFREFPMDIPPVLVVQHMPSKFTKLFADRLNNFCRPEVKEAVSNEYLRRGLILIAPADQHMFLRRSNSRLMVKCEVGQKMHGVMPAVDVLFESTAPIMKDNAVGVILTGMGQDGARGLLAMRNNGAYTIGQNKESCVVYGMPKAAYDLGAVQKQVHKTQVAKAILDAVR